ncbi:MULTISPECIES: BlaI/MecI/CopY family transcriptional regulator [Sphingobacterium]|jgi:predicted transcriptional regulator|uniref:Transcriptional regulator n=3 Tax=Sphingobacterium TaxID=28453 RepID=A0A420G2W8_9SPHI|nr:MULTISPECIES: BlaI/MecI/CopY family transcriptional regulator [Sphingobacterium]APU95911.1 transcriptional regulator [Sphingobacterium sp. B29]MBB1645826.1 transcriptional regulator [Sphingobacterium sp. UME9]MCS4166935.1 putative transcriptional regulator [Sphingobacterium sp. BIGb0116]QMV69150.1 BlaI/MecI/CopY family transcriptional regulator [Sphingobacterium paramultivorum]QQT31519.1 BlaI/MecI/CopY family transcriptional regulator [Sphingobacterium multivorum]
MEDFKELTKAEEQIMQELWEMGRGFVKEIIDRLSEPKPAYNTVSTIVRILETKGFVTHESFGKSHQYLPKISKEEYKKGITGKLLTNYFDNSPKSMLSYFLEENRLDIKELDDILSIIERNK